jgi:RNA polymerase sigma factor (sigma-70 family)
MAREGRTVAASVDQIIVRAVAGDRDALTTLLERFGAEVAQRVAGQIDGLDACDARSFCAWLTRVAENNLHDAIRGLQAEKRPHPAKNIQPSPDHDSYVGLFELAGGTGTTPSRAAARGEIRQLIEAAVRKLPDDYAEVVRLCDLQGHSVADVAERMGRSRGAVHMLRARALGRLQAILGSESKFFSDSA